MSKEHEGELAKDAGMALGESAANPDWKVYAAAAVLHVARSRRYLTTDDVVPLIPAHIRTHDMRALGSVMRNAAMVGVIEKAPMLPIKCATRPSNHRRPLTVWQSLVFKEAP